MTMREREFIDWIRQQGAGDSSDVLVGPGDDCAVVTFGGEKLLITTDQVLDGVHFRLGECGAAAAGRKAMARALSDIAAMAGEAKYAVATVAGPEDLSTEDAQDIYNSLSRCGGGFACPLVGGDVAIWDGGLCITVTVVGAAGDIEPVLRSGATAGDAICVTGSLGGSWRSRRHLDFTPRIREARLLAERCGLHAMIDISDGLSVDLRHICRASGVGAEINAAAVPVSDNADGLAAALNDGEDYELLFALAPEQADALIANRPLDVPIARIGEITTSEEIILSHPDGRREELHPGGWEHESK